MTAITDTPKAGPQNLEYVFNVSFFQARLATLDQRQLRLPRMGMNEAVIIQMV